MEQDQPNKNIQISLKSILDLSSLELSECRCLDCYGFLGKHLLFTGLTDYEGDVLTLDYDLEASELVERRDMRQPHREYRPLSLRRISNSFYCTGYNGRLVKISYN